MDRMPTVTVPAAFSAHEFVPHFFDAPVVKVDESRSDMESLHPADERESLLTLPDAVPDPAPLFAAATNQVVPEETAARTRTGEAFPP